MGLDPLPNVDIYHQSKSSSKALNPFLTYHPLCDSTPRNIIHLIPLLLQTFIDPFIPLSTLRFLLFDLFL